MTTPTPLTPAEIEALREKVFSVNNPFCPVDKKSMRKAAEAVEFAVNAKWQAMLADAKPDAWGIKPRYEDLDGFFDFTDNEQVAKTLESRGWEVRPLFDHPAPAAEPVNHCQCASCKKGNLHASDCAVHNAPAMPNRQCDCGAAEPVNKQLLEALKVADEFIDGIRQDLHHERISDWYPEGAHNAATVMSETMRLIGNRCADFDAARAAIEEAEKGMP